TLPARCFVGAEADRAASWPYVGHPGSVVGPLDTEDGAAAGALCPRCGGWSARDAAVQAARSTAAAIVPPNMDARLMRQVNRRTPRRAQRRSRLKGNL